MLFLKNDYINNKKGIKNDQILQESLGLDDIRDIFLDDPETVINGSEDDADVEKAIEKLPGFDFNPTNDADDDDDLSELIESFIPDSFKKENK